VCAYICVYIRILKNAYTSLCLSFLFVFLMCS
jgi:hypothetical protein